MIISIDHLKDDPGTFEPYDFSFTPENDEGYELLAPIHASGTVVFGGNTYMLSGHLSGGFEIPCSSCLATVKQELELDFDEEFEVDEFPDVDAVIDVEDIAAQVWSASIPMRVLCMEECKGLCPSCGANWNEGDCECPQTEADPRLEVLRSLFEKEV